jgi:hypothetical protein
MVTLRIRVYGRGVFEVVMCVSEGSYTRLYLVVLVKEFSLKSSNYSGFQVGFLICFL